MLTCCWSLIGRVLVSGFVLLALAQNAHAASVIRCVAKTNICEIRIEEGRVHDLVKILDDKGREVARGKIIRQNGAFATVKVEKMVGQIERNYPVMVLVDNEKSDLQRAASFSYKDR